MLPTRDEGERIIYHAIRAYFRRYADKQAVDLLSFLYGMIDELAKQPNFVIAAYRLTYDEGRGRVVAAEAICLVMTAAPT
jgi:hypothetical protein